MITADAIREIIVIYTKHGWKLRRVLLSAELKQELGVEMLDQLPAGVDVQDSDLDAAWFSRQSLPGSTAWELRRLGPLPFALVTGVPANASAEELESILSEAEERLRQSRPKFGQAA